MNSAVKCLQLCWCQQLSVTLHPHERCGFQSALRGSPWGLMQALEQQVEELRMDDAEACHGATGEEGPGSAASSAASCRDDHPRLLLMLYFPGFCEVDEGKSPKRRAPSTEPTDPGSSWPNARPKSVGK